jgi:hypothetical protein
MTFTEALETAAVHARRRVYEQLWLELTIVGRDVWSRNDLQASEKLDGLKWLNEIQHRVWGAHANADGYSPTDLYVTIQHHAAQASALKDIVGLACARSLRVLTTTSPESE